MAKELIHRIVLITIIITMNTNRTRNIRTTLATSTHVSLTAPTIPLSTLLYLLTYCTNTNTLTMRINIRIRIYF